MITALGFAAVRTAIELLLPYESGAGGLRWANLAAAWSVLYYPNFYYLN